jgi:peptidoglycan/LPS O-acetylase OafA/YrhL
MTLNHQTAKETELHRRFRVLDSWRGIAALIVAFGHIKTSGWLSTLPLATTSYRFVDFFFVLSGFVIAYSNKDKLYSNPSAIGSFLINRVARLWPLHLFVLGLFLFYQITLFF